MKTSPRDLRSEMKLQMENKDLFRQVIDYAFHYADQADHRTVYPDKQSIVDLSHFHEDFPEHSGDPQALLQLLHEKGSPATVAQTGGRYFGFVNGGAIPASLAARWLADFWDQNAALYVMSPLIAELESICEQWLSQLMGFPEDTAAGFVGGTSMANVCGLAAARHHILEKQGWDVGEDGLFGAPPVRVILGGEAHSSVNRALSILGFGRGRVERVKADEQGRMIAAELPKLDATCLIICQAGNVNSGAFDPFDEICDLAEKAGAWVHIDGAFGLWAAASKPHHHLAKGMSRADSWAVDAHKTLNVPYDSGIVMCRHRAALLNALKASGSYLQLSGQREAMMYVADMSRRGRAVELWAALKYLGRSGVEELVNGLFLRAKQFEAELKAEGFIIPNKVVFNQVLVQCENDELTKAALANIQQSGTCWCGGAIWKGKSVIRISVCSWVTTQEDVTRTVQAFIKARREAIETVEV